MCWHACSASLHALSPGQTDATRLVQHFARNVLRAFGHHVAQCCVRLSNPAQHVATWSNNVASVWPGLYAWHGGVTHLRRFLYWLIWQRGRFRIRLVRTQTSVETRNVGDHESVQYLFAADQLAGSPLCSGNAREGRTRAPARTPRKAWKMVSSAHFKLENFERMSRTVPGREEPCQAHLKREDQNDRVFVLRSTSS